MQRKSFLKATLLSLLTGSVFAGGMYNEAPYTPSEGCSGSLCDELEYPLIWGKVITLSAGPVWAKGGDTQSFWANPFHYNTYRADENSSTMGSGEMVFSVQRTINPWIMGQFGIGIAGTGTAKLEGTVLIDGFADQGYYRYNYRINHARITFKGALLGGNNSSLFNPYINGSFGIAYNHAYHFQATPILPIYPPMPNFQSNTHSTAFAYTVGAGISKLFAPNWRAAVGYEFGTWGKSNLGPVRGQPYNAGISLNYLYTHALLFSLSYVC